MIKEIIRIKYADTTLPESWIFEGGDSLKEVPIIFSIFLVKTDSKNILVDAGCETMPGFKMKNFTTPMGVLSKMGVQTEDITDVVITHAHHDHIECVGYFKNATVHIQKDEYEEGKKYLCNNRKIEVFENDKVVDDGVRAVKIGGHSKGSCIVECDKDGKKIVLCGDECYSFYNLKNRVPTAQSCCHKNSRAFIEKYSSEGYECLLCHKIK